MNHMTLRRLLIILALLLSACAPPPPGRGAAGPVYGPHWPHGICNAIDACWPVDGARSR